MYNVKEKKMFYNNISTQIGYFSVTVQNILFGYVKM